MPRIAGLLCAALTCSWGGFLRTGFVPQQGMEEGCRAEDGAALGSLGTGKGLGEYGVREHPRPADLVSPESCVGCSKKGSRMDLKIISCSVCYNLLIVSKELWFPSKWAIKPGFTGYFNTLPLNITVLWSSLHGRKIRPDPTLESPNHKPGPNQHSHKQG